MIKPSILIVEDEPIIAEDIAMNLEDFGYTVLDIVSSVDEATNVIAQKKPQLILVDINLEGDKNGIDLGVLLNNKYKIPFIYLTSHYDDNTIAMAKATNPAGYILKPFDERDLKINLEMALFKQKPFTYQSEKIFVKKNQEFIALAPHQITYVEAIDNYAFVHTATERYMISHTLKSIEEKLIDKGFLRVHKSFLINFEHIDSITDGFVLLGTKQVPVGKAYRTILLEFITTL